MKRSLLVLTALLISISAFAQDPFYKRDAIQKIEVFFSQPDWNHQMHVLKITTEGYLKADSVRINGIRFANCGVKYKGNSSYDSTQLKNPLHIALDKYQDQDYQGYNDIKLSNCYQDPSMIREVLSYQILANYMECPQANFAIVYINGIQFGLYSNIEDVGKGFCAKHFKSNKSNAFFKCNPIVTPGPNTKSNLKYLGADSTLYTNFYEMKSAKGWSQFISICSTATNNAAALGQVVDMDRFIWMLAYDNVLVNLDSYMGAFSQNYYMFRDNNGFFNPVVWDLNMSFAGFPFAGSGNSSLGTLSIANAKQFPISFHQTDPYWPMINAIHANGRYKKMYQAHIRSMVNEFFVNSLYDTLASHLRAMIDTAVENDPNKFFTHAQFQEAMTSDISIGTYLVPGIRNLMSARTTYLLSRPEISATAPTIVNHSASYTEANGEITVVARFSSHSDTAVYLGFRADSSRKFQRIRMLDDGFHGDGVAGDQIYGVSFFGDPDRAHYYLYVENDNAAAFLPERAEFEYFTFSDITSSKTSFSSFSGGFNLFPNPANSMVCIEAGGTENTHLHVMDAMGRITLQKVILNQERIDVSSWKAGVYLVRIGETVRKLFVSN